MQLFESLCALDFRKTGQIKGMQILKLCWLCCQLDSFEAEEPLCFTLGFGSLNFNEEKLPLFLLSIQSSRLKSTIKRENTGHITDQTLTPSLERLSLKSILQLPRIPIFQFVFCIQNEIIPSLLLVKNVQNNFQDLFCDVSWPKTVSKGIYAVNFCRQNFY